jgi:NAD-dependent deacetylase
MIQPMHGNTKVQNIFILTGAGISAESGIPTFRGVDGLWEGYRLEDVACPDAFRRNPSLVYRFYNMRREKIVEVQPNAAHLALARLQREYPGTVTLVTQNVDDLHERAGSTSVIHMHGEAMKARCVRCGDISPCGVSLDETHTCPACGKTGTLRPHIVWFGETPLFMDEIEAALLKADLFLSIGTSGFVYPAAGFARTAARNGCRTIEVNLDTTEITGNFDEHLRGPATVKVSQWVEEILSKPESVFFF